jgi:hypothetical protein
MSRFLDPQVDVEKKNRDLLGRLTYIDVLVDEANCETVNHSTQ